MKKRTLVVIVSIFIFLITASIVGAKAMYETKPVPKGERHHISEIIQSRPNGKRSSRVKDLWKESTSIEKEIFGWLALLQENSLPLKGTRFQL